MEAAPGSLAALAVLPHAATYDLLEQRLDRRARLGVPRLDGATIVAIFDAANTADVETGELAVARAQNADVRELGRMFANDHRAVRQQGRDLARRLGVTPTPPANDQSAERHRQALAALRGKSGVEFDRAFLDHEIAYHAAVIDAITKTLPARDLERRAEGARREGGARLSGPHAGCAESQAEARELRGARVRECETTRRVPRILALSHYALSRSRLTYMRKR